MRYFLAGLLFLVISLAGTTATAQSRPGLYLDCQMGYCDFTYLKQEVRFVNYMMNRQEADIYVLATRQETGAGGGEVQLVFIGSGRYEGMVDTLRFVVDPNATEAIAREQFVKELKRGLLPYLLASPLADQIDYQVAGESEAPSESSEAAAEPDPWNYWVFNVGGNGFLSGEASFRNTSLSGRFSANRITDQHKLRFNANYSYERSSFFLLNGDKFTSLIKSYTVRGMYAKSLGQHWSAGLFSFLESSTFSNTDLAGAIKPALEFNLYPYDEVQNRQFSFLYSIGPEYFNFTDTTLYNKLEQVLLRHGLNIEFSQTQRWGSVSLSLGMEQFLHNPKLFNAYLNPEIEWQIVKGLSVNGGGYFSFVRDRINISKEGFTDEDILLRIKQLDTSFTYFTYFGINYRIGSKFNNFVNPRFGSLY